MSLFWGPNGEYWEPQGGERKAWRDLERGDLLVLERQVWRVREVRLVPVADWDEHDEKYFAPAGSPSGSREEWAYRPVYLILVPVNGGKQRHAKALPYMMRSYAYVLHPHYPVCRDCGEPWPCRELDIKREVDKQSAEYDRLTKILPGCCWHCGKPVTKRMKSHAFDGENLLLPGAPPPVFHMRGGYCVDAAIRYEKKLVAADPTRHPRLYCTGRLIIHFDGPECSEDPFCPGPEVSHPSFWNHRASASYVRGCLRCKDACAQQGIVVPAAPGTPREGEE